MGFSTLLCPIKILLVTMVNLLCGDDRPQKDQGVTQVDSTRTWSVLEPSFFSFTEDLFIFYNKVLMSLSHRTKFPNNLS